MRSYDAEKYIPWNKCEKCGRFIGLEEFNKKKAERVMVYPDSHESVETYETYHFKCGYKKITDKDLKEAARWWTI